MAAVRRGPPKAHRLSVAASRNPTAREREACRRRRKRSWGFLASARSRHFRTADATAIAAARSASPAALRRRRHHMDDAIAARLQFDSISAAMRRRFAPGCRAATGCLFPWPRAGSSRDRTPARRKYAASRRPENRRSRSGCPASPDSPRQLRRAAGPGIRKNGASACRVVPQGRLHRGNAIVDLLFGAFDRHAVHVERMILGVGADGMAGVAKLADAFRIGAGPCGRSRRRLPSRIARRGCPESDCCCAAAARRQTSAPPRDLQAGSVSGYCMVPTRRCSRGSTTRVREVPSASGWPGQSAANAAGATMQPISPQMSAAHCLVRTPASTPSLMKPIPSCIPKVDRSLHTAT